MKIQATLVHKTLTIFLIVSFSGRHYCQPSTDDDWAFDGVRDGTSFNFDTNADSIGELDTGDFNYNRFGGPSVDTTPVPCNARTRCNSRDTHINSNGELEFHEMNCFCDDMCLTYNDCCKDYQRPPNIKRVKVEKNTISCMRVLEIERLVELYVINKCPRGFDDSNIRDQCEDDTLKEAFYHLPVSSKETGLLYRNIFCASCAGDVNVTFWNVKIDCAEEPHINDTSDEKSLVEETISDRGRFCEKTYTIDGAQPRKCKSNIAQCPKSSPDKLQRKCKRGPTSYVYAGTNIFKNRFCAECNDINETYHNCMDTRSQHIPPWFDYGGPGGVMSPFSLLLDFNSGSGKVNKVGLDGTREITRTIVEMGQCTVDHVYDPFAKRCRRIRCGDGYVMRGGNCESEDAEGEIPFDSSEPKSEPEPTKKFVPGNDRGINYFDEDRGPIFVDGIHPNSDVSNVDLPSVDTSNEDGPRPECIGCDPDPHNEDGPRPECVDCDCPRIELHTSEYNLFSNQSLFVFTYDKIYHPENYFLDNNGNISICSPFSDRNYTSTRNITMTVLMFKYDRYQSLLSLVGSLISLMALFIHFVIYMMLPPLRNIPGKILISLVVALFFAQLLYLVGIDRTEVDLVCFILGAFMHYCWLAAFCWMNVMAMDICRTFTTRSLTSSPDTRSKRFHFYSLYAWIIPALIVGGALALDFLLNESPYAPHYGEGICWITQRDALLYLFALPLAVLLLIDIVMFIVVVVKICQIREASKMAKREKDKGRFVLYLKLCVVMGLTWAFGFIAALTDLQVLWYVFIVLNSLQGAFICFAFVVTRKVFRLLHGHDARRAGPRYSGSSGYSNGRGYNRSYMFNTSSTVVAQETSI